MASACRSGALPCSTSTGTKSARRRRSAEVDLSFTPDELAFRDELRAFFRREIPAAIREKVSAGAVLAKTDIVASHRILNANGLAVPHWPVQWGGRDWSPVQRTIFVEELQRAAVPLPLQFNCYMVGPVIARFGSEEQKRRFLPRAANLDDWWCQGFSEPDAGSDLASPKTTARPVGDRWIVNARRPGRPMPNMPTGSSASC